MIKHTLSNTHTRLRESESTPSTPLMLGVRCSSVCGDARLLLLYNVRCVHTAAASETSETSNFKLQTAPQSGRFHSRRLLTTGSLETCTEGVGKCSSRPVIGSVRERRVHGTHSSGGFLSHPAACVCAWEDLSSPQHENGRGSHCSKTTCNHTDTLLGRRVEWFQLTVDCEQCARERQL